MTHSEMHKVTAEARPDDPSLGRGIACEARAVPLCGIVVNSPGYGTATRDCQMHDNVWRKFLHDMPRHASGQNLTLGTRSNIKYQRRLTR
jgi:hypothetical protein